MNRFSRIGLVALTFACFLAAGDAFAKTTARAAQERTSSTKKAVSKGKKKSAPKAKASPANRPSPAALAEASKIDGKVALFPFGGNDGESIQGPVTEVLSDKGLTVMTDLRPVDMAEQFRDLAATLQLAAFVDGKVNTLGDKSKATISIRSGYSGRRVASFVVAATPDELPGQVTEKLWTRLGPTLRRACADAKRPRRRAHAPMQINAGTPLDNHPASQNISAASSNVPG
jgi:hypothetical protein